MNRLLEHVVAKAISPMERARALERGYAELKTTENGWGMRFFALRSGRRRDSGLPKHSIARKRLSRIVPESVSHNYPASCSVTASGSIRPPAAGSLFCFRCAALQVTVSTFGGPSANAGLRPWESDPLAWLRRL
jgi:hypothetical protein